MKIAAAAAPRANSRTRGLPETARADDIVPTVLKDRFPLPLERRSGFLDGLALEAKPRDTIGEMEEGISKRRFLRSCVRLAFLHEADA
jgi:hypothetical protein